MARRELVVLAMLGAPLAGAQHPADTDPRAELHTLETALTRAADSVARPGVFAVQAGECRGYRIAGVGAVFVLPPRALAQTLVMLRRGDGRGARRMRVVAPEFDREIRIIEQQAEALQREAVLAHQQVERAVAEVQSEIQRRQPDTPEAPEPPEQPAPPQPPTPPWTLWFDAGLDEEPAVPAATVIARMRAVLVETLSAHGSTLHALRPEETLAAAVDFVPGFAFGGAKVEKTLVVKIMKKDLDEREAGRIGVEELRARVEAAEY